MEVLLPRTETISSRDPIINCSLNFDVCVLELPVAPSNTEATGFVKSYFTIIFFFASLFWRVFFASLTSTVVAFIVYSIVTLEPTFRSRYFVAASRPICHFSLPSDNDHVVLTSRTGPVPDSFCPAAKATTATKTMHTQKTKSSYSYPLLV